MVGAKTPWYACSPIRIRRKHGNICDACAAHKGAGDAPPTAVLGFCWPSVLAALLSHHVAYSNQLLEGIDAILTEFPDLPDTWQLFGGPALPGCLDGLDFEREQAEESSVAQES